jgi:hypothetical protein
MFSKYLERERNGMRANHSQGPQGVESALQHFYTIRMKRVRISTPQMKPSYKYSAIFF